jgi:hypothetical protein
LGQNWKGTVNYTSYDSDIVKFKQIPSIKAPIQNKELGDEIPIKKIASIII